MNRRDLLTAAGAALPLITAGRVWAAGPAKPRLLVVFLRGAYDAANVVIPTSSSFYYEQRPTLAIARPDPADPNAALPLDADWSLHPALKDSLYPLWQKKQLAFVPFAGTEDMSRSHFETQDSIEMGQPLAGAHDYGSGFMNRLTSALSGAQPIAFTDQVPLTFRGAVKVPNTSVGGTGKPGVDERQARLIANMYQNQPLASSVTQGFEVRDEVYKSLSAEMQAANRGAASAKGFELSARRIARLMRDQFNIGFVDIGGWDTHVNQGAAEGQLAGRLGELGRGLAGFADEIGPEAWTNTVVVCISEFGRTFKENGDRGTDHGHGTAYWVLGGQVNGGQMLGDQVRVERVSLNQDRDYPVVNEYRAVLGGLFERMYGLDQGRLAAVFPQAQPRDLRIV
jgi:uncharacterized protein (DUF1501 family)